MKDYEQILCAMETFYMENNNEKSAEYDYGFLDALSVIRDLHERGILK